MPVADGNNHAIPNDKELTLSIRWLLKKGLIQKSVKRVSMTAGGQKIMQESADKTGEMNVAWERLVMTFEKLGADNQHAVGGDLRQRRNR